MIINLNTIDKSKKIYDVCQSENDTNYTAITLSMYLYDQTLMRDCDKVPFVMKNGRYEWAVEMQLVTVAELIGTFPDLDINNIEFNTCYTTGNIFSKYLNSDRKNFKIFWKKTKKEWRDVECTKREIHSFFKKLNQYPVSPMSVIQAIYLKHSYYILEFCEMFSCTKREAKSVLHCLGFREGNIKEYYEKEWNFQNAVLNGCNMAANCDKKEKKNFKKIILSSSLHFLHGIRSTLECVIDKIAVKTRNNTERIKPARGERSNKLESVVYVLILFGMIAVIIFCYSCVKNYLDTLLNNKQIVEWQQNASSFYGGMIGAIFSGIATIVTTYLVIQRSYKIDYHRERIEVMPVFTAETYCDEDIKKYLRRYKKETGVKLEEIIHDINDHEQLVVIKNIGKGIGFNIQLKRYAGDWEEYNFNTMEPMLKKAVRLQDMEERKILIQYNDLYENQYSQYIHIYHKNDEIKTIAEQPELVMRTKRMRYVQ